MSKDISEYFKTAGYRDGYRRQCKQCCVEANNVRIFHICVDVAPYHGCPEQRAKHDRRWSEDEAYRLRAKEYARRHRLFKRYGVTVEEYDRLFDAQGGVCAICSEPPSKANTRWGCLHVDHCHKTGGVRGLLCAACNQGLGNFKDDGARLASANRYLTQPRVHLAKASGVEGA